MNPKVHKDVLAVLSKAITLLKTPSQKVKTALAELSDHTIHCCTVFQDEDSMNIGVLVYAIAKTIKFPPDKKRKSLLLNILKTAKLALEENNLTIYRSTIKQGLSLIEKENKKINDYVGEITAHASAKKGCKIHEHGVSVGRAAELSGSSQWEIMNYLGRTKIPEDPESKVKQRIAIVRRLFK